MQRVPVTTPNGDYDVVIDSGGLERAAEYIGPIVGDRRIFIVADEQAWRHQGARLEQGLGGLDWTRLSYPGGEERKRLAEVERLCDQMFAAGADRSACVIAFGGGIAGDVGGFVAASYMRGVDVIQVPTTLLAQVDAAVGGKTGVNLAEGKNLIGAFHQPRLVLMDPLTLRTLPDREYRAGLFEVVKHGIIRSRSLFDSMTNERDRILARDAELLEAIISESVAIKAAVVARDEKEGGLRRILNYGHTLGHALEAETGYRRLLHGEAVGFGMIAAAFLAESLDMISTEQREALERTIVSYGPIPLLEGIKPENLVARISGDKKTIGGKIHFVLPVEIGKVEVIRDPNLNLVADAARKALDLSWTSAKESPQPVVST
ncbi:MAG: 3-dehydroquinate synthase [Acidobacteria bacterium]|nr:3-dehydroquinate synthase [Acidobacteriota bacterium]